MLVVSNLLLFTLFTECWLFPCFCYSHCSLSAGCFPASVIHTVYQVLVVSLLLLFTLFIECWLFPSLYSHCLPSAGCFPPSGIHTVHQVLVVFAVITLPSTWSKSMARSIGFCDFSITRIESGILGMWKYFCKPTLVLATGVVSEYLTNPNRMRHSTMYMWDF